MTGKNLEV